MRDGNRGSFIKISYAATTSKRMCQLWPWLGGPGGGGGIVSRGMTSFGASSHNAIFLWKARQNSQKQWQTNVGAVSLNIHGVLPPHGASSPTQVQNISLSEGELITVEMLGGLEPVTLANESFLMRGQVIRGPTNQVVVQFRSPVPANPGTFHFRFQGESCNYSRRHGCGGLAPPTGEGHVSRGWFWSSCFPSESRPSPPVLPVFCNSMILGAEN